MEFYTTSELSEMLKVSEELIRRLLRSEKLKGYKVGSYWRIKKEDLEEYLEKDNDLDKAN